jgi:hypothetical protein
LSDMKAGHAESASGRANTTGETLVAIRRPLRRLPMRVQAKREPLPWWLAPMGP